MRMKMQNCRTSFRALLLILLCLMVAANAYSRPRTHHRRAAKKTVKTETAKTEKPALTNPFQVQLILTDGTRLEVDEAWESEQGIWYKQNGVSHLSSRERVKSIERGNQRSR